MNDELRINARGLSVPGPRLMTATALEKGRPAALRVVVSNEAAAGDLREYLAGLGARVEVDHVGAEYHVVARFAAE
jgi:TusA-related sulfurtransferase